MSGGGDRSVPRELGVLFLRVALGAGFLSAVADRLALWGPPGASGVAWGDWSPFLDYTAILVPYLPSSWIPALGALVTGAETALGGALLLGLRTRRTAAASGALLLVFALSMTFATGVKSALDASVFAASGGAFLLAGARPDRFSLDRLLARRARAGDAGGSVSPSVRDPVFDTPELP